jgi:adenine C2-methylase RlmN of 23S rRNA A2503 and tRNA A37
MKITVNDSINETDVLFSVISNNSVSIDLIYKNGVNTVEIQQKDWMKIIKFIEAEKEEREIEKIKKSSWLKRMLL